MRSIPRLSLLTAIAISLAVTAHAGTTDVTAQGSAQSLAQVTPKAAEANASAEASAQVQADMKREREAIEKKAAKTSAQARANAERRFASACGKVDQSARETSDATMSNRLSAELNVTAGALMKEKTDAQASWGEMTIAHSLAANAKAPVTAGELCAWHHDGMGWADMTAGLGLSLGSAVSSIDMESKVARGMAKADGKVAAIYGDGSRGAGAGLDVGANTHLGHNTAGAGAGAGLGVKIGH
jgi:hypothetical protein